MHYTRKTLNKIRIMLIKSISIIMGVIFVCCMCAADEGNLVIIFSGMVISGGWLFLLAYANGWIMDTEPWNQRLEREGHDLH